jgi:hypothetical protein
MDELKAMDSEESSGTGKQTSWEKREEFDDGSYNQIRVKAVKNGFIKSVTKHYKKGDDWKYDTEETIHDENPMEEKSLAEKLEDYLKDD